jgi:ricin-type beta-trefoil lectin protein
MRRVKVYRSRILWITAAVLAVGFGSAAPASAGPQAFFGAQLQTMIVTSPAQCLDVDLGTVGNARTNVHLWHCRPTGDQEQGYQLFDQQSIPGRPGTEFKLVNQRTGKCVTYNVSGGAGSPVWAESCDKNGQGWTIANRDLGDGHISDYVAVETGPNDKKCLDVQNPGGTEGAGIDLWYCDQQPYNRWRQTRF